MFTAASIVTGLLVGGLGATVSRKGEEPSAKPIGLAFCVVGVWIQLVAYFVLRPLGL